jgi:hypothetical protein
MRVAIGAILTTIITTMDGIITRATGIMMTMAIITTTTITTVTNPQRR